MEKYLKLIETKLNRLNIRLIMEEYNKNINNQIYLLLPFQAYFNINLIYILNKVLNKKVCLFNKIYYYEHNNKYYFSIRLNLNYYEYNSFEYNIIKNILLYSYINLNYKLHFMGENNPNMKYFKFNIFFAYLIKNNILKDSLLTYFMKDFIKNDKIVISDIDKYILNDNFIFKHYYLYNLDNTNNIFFYDIHSQSLKKRKFEDDCDDCNDCDDEYKNEKHEKHKKNKKYKKDEFNVISDTSKPDLSQSLSLNIIDDKYILRILYNNKLYGVDDKKSLISIMEQLDFLKIDYLFYLKNIIYYY
jgi:hypothetical protein